jgi:hypothetical protein
MGISANPPASVAARLTTAALRIAASMDAAAWCAALVAAWLLLVGDLAEWPG